MKELLEKASSYLNGDLSYNVGVSVFLKLSKNENLNRVFLLPHSQERELQLKNELSKITKLYEKTEFHPRKAHDHKTGERLRSANESQEFHVIQKDNHFPISSNSLSNRTAVPELIERLQSKRKELYRLRGHLHGQLHSASSDEFRHEIASKIMSTQTDIDTLNRDIVKVNSGETPAQYLKKDRSAEEYVQIRNLKMYISRYEKKLKSCTTLEDKKKFESIIEKHEESLKQLT